MKKIVIVLLLTSFVAAGAFAQQGLGIGAFGTLGGSFQGGKVGGGGALSLKVPALPVYWGISLRTLDNYIGVGIIADFPSLSGTLIPAIGFGWYLHGGLYGEFETAADYSALGLGARLPIGINLRLPGIFLEGFLALVPAIGIHTGNFSGDRKMDFNLHVGWATELGFRIWLFN